MQQIIDEEIITVDRILHLDIRNLQNNLLNYNIWIEFGKVLLERGDHYKSLYKKSNSKSGQAKKKLESMYNKSIDCYNISIKLKPDNIIAWYNKGLALSNLRDYDKALKCYDKAIEINPNYLPAWNGKGDVLNYLMKFQEAIMSYDRVLEKDSGHILAWYNKGFALSNLGDYDKALKCYDKAIEIDPTNADVLNAKGYALERLGRYEEAIRLFDATIEINAKNIEILNATGYEYERTAKYEEAIRLFDATIEINAKNIEALNAKAYALERLGRSEEAGQYYNRVTEEYFNEIRIIKEKAISCEKLDKYDEVIIYYDILSIIDSKNSFYALLNKGLTLYKLNQYEEAIDCYDRIIELYRHEEDEKKYGQELTNKEMKEYYHEALNAKGLALKKSGRYEEAIDVYHQLIEINPTNILDIKIKKGQLLVDIGGEKNYREAEKYFNEVLEVDPKNIDSLIELRSLYANYIFEHDKAISITERLIKNLSDSKSKSQAKILAWLMKKGKYNEGRKLAKELIKENAATTATGGQTVSKSMAKIFLAEELIKKGKYNEGRKLAKELIKETPANATDRQAILRFLTLVSYILQGNKRVVSNELVKFQAYLGDSDKPIKLNKSEWNFKGLIAVLEKKKNIDSNSKTAILELIDLLYGKEGVKIFWQYIDKNIESVNIKRRNKSIIVFTSLAVAGLLILSGMYYQVSCPVLNDINIPVKDTPYGIEINPNTNKVYVVNHVPGSLSIIECKESWLFQFFNFYTSPTVKTIKLLSAPPPYDVALDLDTNKVYVSHLGRGVVSVIDGETDKVIKTITNIGHNPLGIVVNSKNGKIYTANSESNDVSIINGTDYKVTNVSVGTKPINLYFNTKDNKVYVINQNSSSISIIDGETDKVVDTITNIGQNPLGIVVDSKNGKIYVTQPDNDLVSVFDGKKNKIKDIIVGNKPTHINIDKERNQIYVANKYSNSISIIDANTDKVIRTVKVGSSPIDLAINDITNSIYISSSGSAGGIVSLKPIPFDNQSNYIQVGREPIDIDRNTNTSKIYVSNYGSDSVSVIDGENNKVIQENIPVGKHPKAISVNSETNKIYVAQDQDALSIIDGGTDTVANKVTVGKNPISIAVNPKANKIYVANYGDDTLSVIDGNTDTVAENVTVGKNPISITVNPETNKIYVANHGDDTLSVIDGNTDTELNKIIVSQFPRIVITSPDEKEIFVAYDDSPKLTVIDSSTGEEIKNEDVNLGQGCPSDLYLIDNKVYASHDCSKSIYVISNYTKPNPEIQPLEIEMLGSYFPGKNNNSITINSDTFYVTDSESNVISYVNLGTIK